MRRAGAPMGHACGVEAGVDRSQLLLELSRHVTSHLDLQHVFDASLQALRRLLDFGGGAIQLFEDGALVARAPDPPATAEALTVRIPVGQGVSGTIAATGQACYIPDITVDERVYPAGRAKGVSGGVRAYFGVPLILHGAPIGVVSFDSLEVDAFDARDRSTVLSFVPTIAAAVQNAQLFEREVEALSQMRELERLRTDFLAVVSHELRTPLTSISGMAQLLAGQVGPLAPDVAEDLARRIVSNSRRLELLIDDLLDLSQLEHGRLAVILEPTDLAAVVEDAAHDLMVEPHQLSVRTDPALPPVAVDERRVRQVLSNLVSNAAKYSPPEAPIEVTLERVGDAAVLCVADRGEGVPVGLGEKIFDLFFQAEPADTRSVGGLGVGLYLVRQLSEHMGATVTVAARDGGGSRFCVAFPLRAGGGS